jgi:hypothetical protein
MKHHIIIFVCFSFQLGSCFTIGGGTHGALKRYNYAVSKGTLEMAIDSLIKTDSSIVTLPRDGSDVYRKINSKSSPSYSFVFRFNGDKEYWDAHPNSSQIFITAVRKGDEKYRSEGEISSKELKAYIDFFEKNFISKLNKKLIPAH